MVLRVFTAFTLVLLAACSNACNASTEQPMPIFFLGDVRPSETTMAMLHQAEEDFQAVVAGKHPIFANFDEDHPLPADGGTTLFKGNGYNLKIVKALAEMGNLHGYMYGPVITFEPSILWGNYKELSHVTFYSTTEMQKLLTTK